MLFLLIISFSTVHPPDGGKFSGEVQSEAPKLAHFDPKMLQQSFHVSNMREQKFHFLHRTLWTELDFHKVPEATVRVKAAACH